MVQSSWVIRFEPLFCKPNGLRFRFCLWVSTKWTLVLELSLTLSHHIAMYAAIADQFTAAIIHTTLNCISWCLWHRERQQTDRAVAEMSALRLFEEQLIFQFSCSLFLQSRLCFGRCSLWHFYTAIFCEIASCAIFQLHAFTTTTSCNAAGCTCLLLAPRCLCLHHYYQLSHTRGQRTQ